MWDKVEQADYGEKHLADRQFVQTGNAQVGIIAFSLALIRNWPIMGGYIIDSR